MTINTARSNSGKLEIIKEKEIKKGASGIGFWRIVSENRVNAFKCNIFSLIVYVFVYEYFIS